MVPKPFVRTAVWNAMAILIAAAVVPQWWTSPQRDVGAVAIRDKVDGAPKQRHVEPIREPKAWAAAGETTRDAAWATSLLLLGAFVAIRRDWRFHRLLSTSALLAAVACLGAGIAFIVLRPPLGSLRVGFSLIATLVGAPFGALVGLLLLRAPWKRQDA